MQVLQRHKHTYAICKPYYKHENTVMYLNEQSKRFQAIY